MMETSGGAMQAERMRAEVVAANMANAESTRTADGGPFRRQLVVFAAKNGDPNFLNSPTDASHDLGAGAGPQWPAMSGDAAAAVAPGVQVAQVVTDTAPLLKRYDPGHPDAASDGYVSYPDIRTLTRS
jgi:flagellar basal-body rod protein FlgC